MRGILKMPMESIEGFVIDPLRQPSKVKVKEREMTLPTRPFNEQQRENTIMKRNDLLIKSVTILGVVIIGVFLMIGIPHAFDPADVQKLKATKSCPKCDLSGANLSGVDLSNADLFGVDLRGADLTRANLSGASMHGSALSSADLAGANLSGVDLCQADLSGANLSNTIVTEAYFLGANLENATLTGANMTESNLLNASLSNAVWIDGTKCKSGSIGECVK